jgi:hypothetical protein
MPSPVKINFKIYQGSTFNEILRWESTTKVYTTITGISNTAPMVVTAPGHNMVVGWRAKFFNVFGMTDVNSLDYSIVTGISGDDITFNSINAVGYKTYTSGGILEYNQPVSLATYTARMQIRAKKTSTTVIEELTTENDMIVIDDTLKTITLNIDASVTELYTFKSAVYSLEMVNGTIVTPLIYGNVTLDTETTK